MIFLAMLLVRLFLKTKTSCRHYYSTLIQIPLTNSHFTISMVRNVPFKHAGSKAIPGLSIHHQWMELIARLVHYLVVKQGIKIMQNRLKSVVHKVAIVRAEAFVKVMQNQSTHCESAKIYVSCSSGSK